MTAHERIELAKLRRQFEATKPSAEARAGFDGAAAILAADGEGYGSSSLALAWSVVRRLGQASAS